MRIPCRHTLRLVSFRFLLLTSAATLFATTSLTTTVLSGQPAPPRQTEELVSLLPPPVAAVARRFADRSLPPERRLDLLEELLEAGPETTGFLIHALTDEPIADVRALIVGGLDFDASADAAPAVARLASTDPDPEVREIAASKLQWEQVAALKRGARGLRELAAASQKAGVSTAALETEAAHRENVAAGALGLPSPPAVFSATEASSVRVLVLGDFGTKDSGSDDDQERVAAAIAASHKVTPFTFGITVGDNFYRDGLDDPKHPRWKQDWEKPYAGLGIPFFAVPGNHDWLGTPKAIKAEIDYTALSPSKSWRMPAAYYTFTAGPVQFFALDTNEMHKGIKDDQLAWLEGEAAASKAPWRIAYGHHPVLTGGAGHGAAQFGGEDEEIRILREKVLLPVLRKTSLLYVAGHDHELQLLDLKNILQVVAGSGGKESDGVKKLPESLFCAQAFGFAVLEAASESLSIRFARLQDKPGTFAYTCTITRGVNGGLAHSCQTKCPI